MQEWNLTVEKQLPWNMLWRTSYVGNIGLYLYGQSQGNQPLTNGPGSPTTRRPLAKYTEASVMEFSPWDRSHYEGASTELEKQFGSGLLFMTDFTYSKAMDLYNPALDVCDGCGSSESVQNSYDLNSLLGNSAQDAPFRFTFSGTWSLPFGAGQRLASQGWEKVAFGGWQVDGVYQAQPGYPFTPTLSFDNANAGNTSFPNRICSGSLSSPTLQEWFNTSCFVTPPEYQFGNSGRDILFGPGINNLDSALHRSFKIPWGELTQLQFRAEAFNFLNHPQFGEPGSTQGTSTFGVIGATSVANREVQFALRLVF